MALIDSFSRFLYNCKNLFATKSEVSTISEKIPTQASAQNQLADKNFVNSSIQTETATFRGNFTDWDSIPLDKMWTMDHASDPDKNDYMVVRDASGYAPLWQKDNNYYENNVVSVVTFDEYETMFITLYRCKEDCYGSSISPQYDTYSWEVTETNPAYKGTWRFKYIPSSDGKYHTFNWEPEYQINEEPLTAAQVAALNSNITEELTNILRKLPVKPVDTAAQVLSAAEQAQVRTNIGATTPEVFWATYDVTTVAEIDAAVSARKLVLCYENGSVYSLTSNDASEPYIDFHSVHFSNVMSLRVLRSSGDWTKSNTVLQDITNRVTAWHNIPDNIYYPSEKLVYDSFYKDGVIQHTVTTEGSNADGYIYHISSSAWGRIPVSFIDLVTDAGAVFNENSGYFEIGAVTNLSYEEMRRIYADFQPYPATRYFLRDCASRTVLPFFGDGGGSLCFLQGSKTEYIPAIRPNGYPYLYPTYGVTDCYYLRRADSIFLGNSSQIDTSFKNCPLLETLKIVSLSYSLNLSTCPMVTPESVAFIINYASNANITITLSSRNYDYLADNDVDQALRAHTNVTLNII